jgi:hypothetical protein
MIVMDERPFEEPGDAAGCVGIPPGDRIQRRFRRAQLVRCLQHFFGTGKFDRTDASQEIDGALRARFAASTDPVLGAV